MFTWWYTTIWLLASCALHPVLFLWDWKYSYPGKHPLLVLKVTYSQEIWGKFQHLLRKKNFLECFLPSFLLFSRCCLFKEQNWAEGKGKKWKAVSVESSPRDYGWGSHTRARPILRAEHQDQTEWQLSGLRLLLPFFIVFPSKPGVCVPCGFHLWRIYHW